MSEKAVIQTGKEGPVHSARQVMRRTSDLEREMVSNSTKEILWYVVCQWKMTLVNPILLYCLLKHQFLFKEAMMQREPCPCLVGPHHVLQCPAAILATRLALSSSPESSCFPFISPTLAVLLSPVAWQRAVLEGPTGELTDTHDPGVRRHTVNVLGTRYK